MIMGRLVFNFDSAMHFNDHVQIKYRKAAHMKIASAAGVLGEKIRQDSVFNSLVNDQGSNNNI